MYDYSVGGALKSTQEEEDLHVYHEVRREGALPHLTFEPVSFRPNQASIQ